MESKPVLHKCFTVSQMCYLLSDTHWFDDIGGVFDSLALIFSDAPIEKLLLQLQSLTFIIMFILEVLLGLVAL